MVNEHSKCNGRKQQKLNSEGIVGAVVRCPKFFVDQINCGNGGDQEENFHKRVV